MRCYLQEKMRRLQEDSSSSESDWMEQAVEMREQRRGRSGRGRGKGRGRGRGMQSGGQNVRASVTLRAAQSSLVSHSAIARVSSCDGAVCPLQTGQHNTAAAHVTTSPNSASVTMATITSAHSCSLDTTDFVAMATNSTYSTPAPDQPVNTTSTYYCIKARKGTQLPSSEAVDAVQEPHTAGEDSSTGPVFQLPASAGCGRKTAANSASPVGREGRGKGGTQGRREGTPAEVPPPS